MKYVFLSQKFYTDFNKSKYPELEHKDTRPYILLLVKVRGLDFTIPLRSKIDHKYA